MNITNRIRSDIELHLLNFSSAWQQKDGSFSPAVSVYTHAELSSGLPFFTDNEPVRFTRNKDQITPLKGHAAVYALTWLARYNRRLKAGLF